MNAKTDKKVLIYLTGRVLSLRRGECAIILCGGKTTRTSTVVLVLKTEDGDSLFETLNAVYCVSPPEPLDVTCAALPMCA